ncbi:hypothetical protein OsI_36776 [Oryza sativa Indica Group]|uniref:Transposon protein, putative, Mutator sub-class n=1 Tax=Oryza sativa subsp. indica TaxID=39946 RepID=B8BLH1_ORYSI|nr:hypothetical protein OsI_36776 [Oryza sativa Indica Group]
MDLSLRGEAEAAPVYRPNSKHFTIEIHHGGFFCGMGVNRSYVDGKVSWFDYVNSREWGSSLHLLDLVAMLGYAAGPRLEVYWLLLGKRLADGLRIVDNEVEINVMNSVCNRVKNFVLYLDHSDHVSGSNHEDIVLSLISQLPKVMSPVRGCQQKEHGNQGGSNVGEPHDSEADDLDFVDIDYELQDDDDDLFEDNVDGDVLDQGLAPKKFNHKKVAGSKLKGKEVLREEGSDEESSDEEILELPDNTDEINLRFKSFNPEDMNNPVFKVGMVFPSLELLRKAITEYSLKNRVDIKMPRNDITRIKAHCAEGCPWNMADCKMTLPSFAKTVQKEWNLTPSRSKLARARRLALKEIYGDEVAQYNMLWDYGHELRRSNPGSSFYLKLDEGKFSSLYFSLDACKRGFLSGCRPIICLDGCHIKTKFGGQLLTAVGIDPNNCIFPIAMAVVEVESLTTWSWFLQTLKDDLGIVNTYIVDVMTKHCDCRREDRLSEENFLPHCYSINAFKAVYADNIMPCNDKSKWEKMNGPQILPPVYEKKVGRPKKSRRKQPQEVQGRNGPKLTKHGVTIHCSYCHEANHNKKGCELRKKGIRPKHKTRRNLAEGIEEPSLMTQASQPSQLTQEHGPLPDCAFIQENQPTTRPVVLTTSTKEGRSKMAKAKKNAAGTSKKKKATDGLKDGAPAKKKKA